MTFNMTSEMTSNLITESDIRLERVFEIRIRDLRERKGQKQASFSLYVKNDVKDNDYIGLTALKDMLESSFKKGKT